MESKHSSLFSLTIDPVTKANLTETAKWARFLAIVGMVVLVVALAFTVYSVMVLGQMSVIAPNAGYSVNPSLNDNMKIGIVIGSIIMLAIAFFPLLFLLRFANGMRNAINGNDQQRLNISFQSLKIYFRYLGIVVLIVLVMYAVIIALALIGSAAFAPR